MNHPQPRSPLLATALALGLAAGSPAQAGSVDADPGDPSSNAYREGVIWASYVLNPVLQSYELDVDVDGSTAVLRGSVESHIEKRLAERLALRADGIDTVHNEIAISPSAPAGLVTMTPEFAQVAADATIEAMIASKLLWNAHTNALDIDVSARRGVVTLAGIADTQAARLRAGVLAADTPGVNGVENLLEVDPSRGQVDTAHVPNGDERLDDRWIAEKVRSALRATPGLSGDTIDVRVRDGIVTLAGQVESGLARDVAIELADGVRGVRRVEVEGLRIDPESMAQRD